MPRYKLSAVAEGGRTVADILVEKVGRTQALDEGIEALLELPNFPPEAVQFYREGMARGSMREEVCDILLERWHLQFFCIEEPIEASAVPAAPRGDGPAVNSPTVAPVPAPLSSNGKHPERTPRQLLNDELKRLNGLMAKTRAEKAAVDRRYNNLKERRDECLRLLKGPPPPPKVPRAKRTLQALTS